MAIEYEGNRMRLSRAWAVLAILYGLFFYWYTSFSGPLTSEEIAHFTTVVENADGMDPEVAANWIAFMEQDTGDDWAMWNAVDLADRPAAIEGVSPDDTSQEVLDRYTAPFFTIALLRASHPVLMGTAAAPAMDIWGIEGGENWDNGILVRYRSRRDIMQIMEEMVASEEAIHGFKIAALNKTIAFPLDPWFQAGDPRLVLGLIFVITGLLFQLRFNQRV